MKKARIKFWLPLSLLLVLAGYVAWALTRPLPDIKPQKSEVNLKLATPEPQLAWPASKESALGILGSNIYETNGVQQPLPTASTAKIITALTVLRDKPLSPGQSGPIITLGASDIALYQSYVAQEGSVVPVAIGEQISEYQMLQTMMLPSANNMADSLAIWAYGSLTAYKSAATAYLTQLGLKNTTVGTDASGFAPSTTSTASDLVRLGEIAMKNPVLSQIVGQTSATGIPVANTITNVNFLLGHSGIVGIKTGNNDQDLGAFLSASNTILNGKTVTIVTATMGANSLYDAMSGSLPLIQSAQANFKPLDVIPEGSVVANYKSPNGRLVPVKTSQKATINTWQGSQLEATASLPAIAADSIAGQTVSSITITDPLTGAKVRTPLKLTAAPAKPTLLHRLLHP